MNTASSRYFNASAAAERLGITRSSLYAYVSRGLLQSSPGLAPDRTSRYLRAEVERLANERQRGRTSQQVARAALHWGIPVLDSGITLITDQGPCYRGASAVDLADGSTLEEVAALLWRSDVSSAFASNVPALSPMWRTARAHYAKRPIEQRLLPLFAIGSEALDAAADGSFKPAGHDARTGADLLRLMGASLLGRGPSSTPLHAQCGRAWKLDNAGVDQVRRALVLSADHELNTSSFTVRCVASAHSTLRLAVIAGIAALAGTAHGGATIRIESFFDEFEPSRDVRRRLREAQARGHAFPGFGHPLYPQGDMRAHAILKTLLPVRSRSRRILDVVEDLTGLQPTLDLALVILRRHLHLPAGAAFGMFALGRTAGWIAHAIEQSGDTYHIRPRAIYTGTLPDKHRTNAANPSSRRGTTSPRPK